MGLVLGHRRFLGGVLEGRLLCGGGFFLGALHFLGDDLSYNASGAKLVDYESMTAVDNRYFSRAATWSRMDERLVVHDSFSPQAPRMITMEPWHEVVFLSADGEHTIDEFVRHMGAQYDGGPPPGLREQIHEIIQILVGEGILRIHEQPETLPPYFAEELSSQPQDVRKAQMEVDGLLGGDRPQA